MKSSKPKLVSTRRPIVLILPVQQGLPAFCLWLASRRIKKNSEWLKSESIELKNCGLYCKNFTIVTLKDSGQYYKTIIIDDPS